MNSIQATFALGCSIGALALNLNETVVDKANVGVADRLMYQAKNEGGAIWTRTAGEPEDARCRAPAAASDHGELLSLIPVPTLLR